MLPFEQSRHLLPAGGEIQRPPNGPPGPKERAQLFPSYKYARLPVVRQFYARSRCSRLSLYYHLKQSQTGANIFYQHADVNIGPV